MVFSSIIFLFLFLPATLTLYFLVPNRFRNLLLLCVSLLFYAWGEGFFVFIMLITIAVNYFSGLLLERFAHRQSSKLVLFGTVTLNLGLLVAFKYTNFILDNLNVLLSLFNIESIELNPVHLPIGISFFTFQAITYVIDIYRDQSSAQKNPINMGLYIASFPQLIAGPIVRYHDIARQLVCRSVKVKDFGEGVERFTFGLGKKVLIADPMGIIVDQVFALTSQDLTTGVAWLGVVCLSLQVYFDFSGYSDMAIGLGRMFGFRFLENFNYPYISQSMQEFWRRWHISLSNWFRDYLYIPLGGNRSGSVRTYINLVTIFLFFGLWHGASWNFVLFGLYHGSFLVIERLRLINQSLKRLWLPLRVIYVNFIFIVGWPLFRTETIPDALTYWSAMFGFAGGGMKGHIAQYLDTEAKLIFILGVICSTPILPFMKKFRKTILGKPERIALLRLYGVFEVTKMAVLLFVLLASVMCLASGAYNPFVYFRF